MNYPPATLPAATPLAATRPAADHDDAATARTALACLDLTSLNDDDTEADVLRLCTRAQGRFGAVAAVCVWPRFAALARRSLPPAIGVAAVANFPAGGDDIDVAVADATAIVDAGAQEVDLVLPYRALLRGDERRVLDLLHAVRAACPERVLKVILETGELRDAPSIARAARLALAAGADFLKTSTGKTPVSATPEAAATVLAEIAADAAAAGRVGFKPSGGIRTVADAGRYIALCGAALGPTAVQPRRFRIGASSLLDQIEALLGGTASHRPQHGGY